MNDTTATVKELKELAKKFVAERDWEKLNTPKMLSCAIAVEAAELMELFTWVDGKRALEHLEANRNEVAYELSDILFLILCFANEHNIDIADAFERKMKLTGMKYPISQKPV